MPNSELLRLLDLPVFDDVETLSQVINIDTGRLNALIEQSHKFYRRYQIKKKSGKYREIQQPNKEMKAVQAWILRNILDKLSPSSHSTSHSRFDTTLGVKLGDFPFEHA